MATRKYQRGGAKKVTVGKKGSTGRGTTTRKTTTTRTTTTRTTPKSGIKVKRTGSTANKGRVRTTTVDARGSSKSPIKIKSKTMASKKRGGAIRKRK
jgi:hypothetical protein